MKPTALLVTMSRYYKVTSCLRHIKETHKPRGVDLWVEAAADFDDVPLLLRSSVDFIALDGHGCEDGGSAYFGRNCERQFCPEYLRGEDGAGIVAPIVVLGFCWGGKAPFIRALEGSLSRRHAAFLGSTTNTDFGDAERIYEPVLRQLAELGSDPDPADAHARISSIAPGIGETWRSELLPRLNNS